MAKQVGVPVLAPGGVLAARPLPCAPAHNPLHFIGLISGPPTIVARLFGFFIIFSNFRGRFIMAQIAGSDYLEHLAGMAAFMDWIRQNEKQGLRFSFDGPLVECDPRISRRLAIGIPRARAFGRFPFLAAQAPEALFLRLLRFSRASISPNGRLLRLIAPAMPGDGQQNPDLPALALSLSIDSGEKGAQLARASRLAARSLWFEDAPNGELIPEIGSKDVFWSVPLSRQAESEPLLLPAEEAVAFSLQQWLDNKIESTNSYNSSYIKGPAER